MLFFGVASLRAAAAAADATAGGEKRLRLALLLFVLSQLLRGLAHVYTQPEHHHHHLHYLYQEGEVCLDLRALALVRLGSNLRVYVCIPSVCMCTASTVNLAGGSIVLKQSSVKSGGERLSSRQKKRHFLFYLDTGRPTGQASLLT